MSSSALTHISEHGEVRMVDVSAKDATSRMAIAEGHVSMAPSTLDLILQDKAQKGNVLAAARIAGIMAAKRTHELIPLCHGLALNQVAVEFDAEREAGKLSVRASVKVDGKTGVEMEALTAVSVACLTVYDMCKAVDRDMVITGIRILEKAGGRSGHYRATREPDES